MENLISKLQSFEMSMLDGLSDDKFAQFKSIIDNISGKLDGCNSYSDTKVISNPVLDRFNIEDAFAIKRDVFERLITEHLSFYKSLRACDIKKYLPNILVLKRTCPNIKYLFTGVVWGYENGQLTFSGRLDDKIVVNVTFNVTLV